jgi:peroxiredoxin
MKNNRKTALIVVVLSVLGFALYSAMYSRNPAPPVTFTSLKGEKVATGELRGQVVLVNFWATDCPSCIKEMPALKSTYEKYRGRGLELIAVAMRHDPPNYVINFTEKNALPFKVALDPMGELAKAFGDVKLTPTTFLIDKRGDIVTRILGEPDFTRLHELIERKLGESA